MSPLFDINIEILKNHRYEINLRLTHVKSIKDTAIHLVSSTGIGPKQREKFNGSNQ